MGVLGLFQKDMWKLKMNNKLKAIQILEIMLDEPLNNRKVFDQSDDTVYTGEEWLHIAEALAELNQFTEASQRDRHDLNKLLYIFNAEISRCGNCGELKRRGFGCYCENEDE